MFLQLKPKTFIFIDWVGYWWGQNGCSSPPTKGSWPSQRTPRLVFSGLAKVLQKNRQTSLTSNRCNRLAGSASVVSLKDCNICTFQSRVQPKQYCFFTSTLRLKKLFWFVALFQFQINFVMLFVAWLHLLCFFISLVAYSLFTLYHSLRYAAHSQAVWPGKIAKCLSKLAKNDFTRKMIDFDTSTKNT